MNQECVILLHGLARGAASMKAMATALRKAGYFTINYDYPSTKKTIEVLAGEVIKDALSLCPKGATVHFVTHSMGGILVRQYFQDNTIDCMGRVVMLGPPNKGSQIVDSLKSLPGYTLINGPAGLQMGTEAVSVPNTLGDATFELGVIAGTRSINLLLSTLLPKPDDGKVSVENTKLAGMTDHISLPVTHTFMMRNGQVISQVRHFLKSGSFARS